jgi:hypothetical protein
MTCMLMFRILDPIFTAIHHAITLIITRTGILSVIALTPAKNCPPDKDTLN